MKPSEVRAELLRQHAQIRIMMTATRVVAEGACVGVPRGDDLRASLIQLADAVRMHNLQEEALLRDLIPSVDAWGPARASIMTEVHIHEHARLYAALMGIACTPVDFAGEGVVGLIDAIREHMDREEAVFLGEDVLRDDIVVVNQSGG